MGRGGGREGRKIRRAVALGYDPDRDQAPRVLAAGGGDVADRILRAAAEHGIPVREDPELLEVLAGLDVGEEVPPAAYQAMAEILAFIYRLEEELAAAGRG